MPHLLYIVICLFSFAACTNTGKKGNDEEAIRRGNAYIDQMLKDMFSDTDKFDPYEMEDSVIGFNKKVMFVNVTGEAKLYDGTLKGLSTLHRTDDCALHEGKDGRLRVNAKLGAGVLNFLYSGSAKFMNFGPSITVHGDLSFVEMDIEFTVDGKTGKNGTLTKFTIDDMRDMRVWVTGLGPISWAMNPVIKAVTKVFKRILRYFLENTVQKYISNRLPNYQFPVEGGGITDSPVTKPTEPEETTQTTEQELTTQTPEPEITTLDQTTITIEPEITSTEQTTQPPEPETTQPPEPETTTPTPEEPITTVSEEPETQTPEVTETPAPEEPETQTPEVTETPAPEEPETQTPEVTETPAPEEPETQTPEVTETPVPEEPETQTPEVTETPVPEEPETQTPVETENPPPEEPADVEE